MLASRLPAIFPAEENTTTNDHQLRFVIAVVISLGGLSTGSKSSLEARGIRAYAFAELLVLVSASARTWMLVGASVY